MSEDLHLEQDGHVAVLTLDRPPNNHVSVELVREIADRLEELSQGETRCVVLASTGRVFCGGADLSQPRGLASGEGRTINPLYVEAARIFGAPLPLVAAVQGAAVGAGLGLSLACDFRLAGPEARFAANFVKLGFHPGFGLSHTLPRLIGPQRASLMMLTGRRIKADEALAWGLVDQRVESGRERDAALALAQEIAAGAPLAVRSTRATLRAGLTEAVIAATDHELAEQTRLMRTEDFREGLRAVAERREGDFKGR